MVEEQMANLSWGTEWCKAWNVTNKNSLEVVQAVLALHKMSSHLRVHPHSKDSEKPEADKLFIKAKRTVYQ